LQVNKLKKHFDMRRGQVVKAVDGVSFDVNKGETYGLVGESGCGKSTIGRPIMGLYENTAGDVTFYGQKIHELYVKEKHAFYRIMPIISQTTFASCSSRTTDKDIIVNSMEVFGLYIIDNERLERVYELLEEVGLNRDHANRYPHEFSVGQRQRLGIARALALDPDFIIADEPISALDVSVQAQVVNLLKRLQEEKGLTFLFIAHD